MRKQTGGHFYINILNFNDVVEAEEQTQKELKHSIHALDTFFSSIETYGKKYYANEFVVEKVTGSRLHMYVQTEDIQNAFSIIADISAYAFSLTDFMSSEIAKYKTLLKFSIQIGADFGRFYEFEFHSEEIEEMTTIGYPANFAAKLQNLAAKSQLNISEIMFDSLPLKQKNLFIKKNSEQIKKYEQKCYYTTNLSALTMRRNIATDLEKAKDFAKRVNLTEMRASEVRKLVNFESITKKEYKKVQGIPLYADVRDFTRQFNADGSNLEEMTERTANILKSMYTAVKKRSGVHIQFQGDREQALFHDYGNYSCTKDAVIAGLEIIDAIKDQGVTVGVGQAIGTIYVTKIGARGEKDNLLLGKTVNEADSNEDEKAGKNQLVISKEIYDILRKSNPILANLFRIYDVTSYYTEKGYREYLSSHEYRQQRIANSSNSYNGAWGSYDAESVQ